MTKSNVQVANALERAGYFSDLKPAQAAALHKDVSERGYVAALDHPFRRAMADSEELAEGGVADWLGREIAPILATRHVTLPPLDNQFPEDGSGYAVVSSGRTYLMWRRGEADTAWGTSTVGAFNLVNDVLEHAHATERLYLIGGGNDGQAWLLTPAQAQIIREFIGVKRQDWPYIPTNDGTSWFGQPH